jgi:2-keto-4-pentenoate hydratase/2-oxohepta-3-ene-1,7-dioic acid hydratase in catechol pathway
LAILNGIVDRVSMKIALFQSSHGEVAAGLITERGIVSFSSILTAPADPQALIEQVIDNYESLKPQLRRLVSTGIAVPVESIRLLPPLPRPRTIFSCVGNYWEHAQREAQPLNMWLKNPDAVVGDGDVVRLPDFEEPWMFMHEAELGIVLKGPSKNVAQDNYLDAVFGYTCFMDITARGQGRATWRPISWMGKNFDTFAPIGPCIVTADELLEPNNLLVRFWNDGQLRHNYSTDDMEHRVPELVAFATRVMTVQSGDLIACGTNHEGLGPVQDGEVIEIEIESIGRMTLRVEDPLKRVWERGIYMGADSTNLEAVRRHRPGA